MYLVASFVTMQVVDAVFQYLPFQDPDAVGRLVLMTLVVGFPVAMGLAWVLELTPPRLHRELSREEAATRVAAPPDKELRPDSVAVLPFENLSDDQENEYFSDGITDDIISSIAHIQGLRVLSRTSVMAYKGAHKPTAEIATELGVATLVIGSVRRSGSRIRVVAEVVDTRSDDHLWAETYDRELEDIFQVQSEVATCVADAVHRELSPSDKRRIEARGTSDPEAYDLYLRGRFLWNQRSESSVADSVRYFERALERDPAFASAHSGLADAFTILGVYGLRAPRTAYEAARRSAEAALALDPLLGEATAALANIHALFDWKWELAEAGFASALEQAPSYPTARQWLAVNLLTPLGRFDEAKEQLRVAGELDPASSAVAASAGIVSFYARDLAGAQTEFESVVRVHPRFALVHSFLGSCYELAGDQERAVDAHRKAVDLSDESAEMLAGLGHSLGRAGLEAEAEGLLQRLNERAERRYVSPTLLARVLIGLGRTEEALTELERARDARATDLAWLGVRPSFDPLREEGRFAEVVRSLGVDGRAPTSSGGTTA